MTPLHTLLDALIDKDYNRVSDAVDSIDLSTLSCHEQLELGFALAINEKKFNELFNKCFGDNKAQEYMAIFTANLPRYEPRYYIDSSMHDSLEINIPNDYNRFISGYIQFSINSENISTSELELLIETRIHDNVQKSSFIYQLYHKRKKEELDRIFTSLLVNLNDKEQIDFLASVFDINVPFNFKMIYHLKGGEFIENNFFKFCNTIHYSIIERFSIYGLQFKTLKNSERLYNIYRETIDKKIEAQSICKDRAQLNKILYPKITTKNTHKL